MNFFIGLFIVASSVALASGTEAQLRTQAAPDRVPFSKKKIRLAKHVLEVEIADTPLRREQGLMFRKSLGKDAGMLFIFETELPLAFWMKNTLIPLSIGYFDKDKKLVDIQEMTPAPVTEMHPKTYPSKRPAMFALEMSKGWFSSRSIKLGTTFSFVEP